MRKINKFKKGAASFYIVAISTLILVIIAASFAAVIISELSRTSNDDLAQSAYDSALAGVEDAKLAYYNYQYCKDHLSENYGSANISCNSIVNDSFDLNDCGAVAKILGKKELSLNSTDTEVEVNGDAGQYYTCVTMTDVTDDVKATLSESNPDYTMRAKFANAGADNIQYVKLSWGIRSDDNKNPKISTGTGDFGMFERDPVKPAVVALSMVQTAEGFELSDFDMSSGDETNRGTVFLVPYIGDFSDASVPNSYNYSKVNADGTIDSETGLGLVKSNDKTPGNKPFLIECSGTEYRCEVTIGIPKPIGGTRKNDTFFFNVSLPYGGPETDFKLEFYKDLSSDPVQLDGVQVKVDSTGRANDLYRRVETRLEAVNTLPFPIYAIEALGNDGEASTGKIIKSITTTCEYDFKPKTCNRS